MYKILEGAFRVTGGGRFEGLSKSSTGIDWVSLLVEYIGYAFFGAVIVVAEIGAHLIGGVDVPTRQQAMMDIFLNYPVLFGIIDVLLYMKEKFSERKAEY